MFCYLWVLSAWKELDCHQQKTFPPTSATLQAFQDSACLEPFFEIQEEDVTPPRRVLLTTCMLQVSGFWFIIIAWHPEVSEESSPAMSINCTGRNQSCQKSGGDGLEFCRQSLLLSTMWQGNKHLGRAEMLISKKGLIKTQHLQSAT